MHLIFFDQLNDELEIYYAQGWNQPKIFSMEIPQTGQRVFSVLGCKDLIRFYHETLPTERHIYEIIRENTPSKLYFDLEFNCRKNCQIDGTKLVNITINAVGLLLWRECRILLERCHVLELDCSTKDKFSRHLTFNLPQKYVFRNNYECGLFVRKIYKLIASKIIVLNQYGEPASFIDMSVYSRNRAFRLPWNCKFGKEQIFIPATNNTFHVDTRSDSGLIKFLEDSFISPINSKSTESLAIYPIELTKHDSTLTIPNQNNGTFKLSKTVRLHEEYGEIDSKYLGIMRTIIAHAAKNGRFFNCPPTHSSFLAHSNRQFRFTMFNIV